MEHTIRLALRTDVPAILDIFNEAIQNTTASYEYEPRTLTQRLAWFDEHAQNGYPIYVAEDTQGQVVGWSSLSVFNARAAYQHTAENSIYIAPSARGKGLGARLMAPLIDEARNRGFHAIVALIDADNVASIKLHDRFGFVRCGHLKQVGRKFGRWLDLVLMQLLIDNQPEDDGKSEQTR